jgi:hypothetical protein
LLLFFLALAGISTPAQAAHSVTLTWTESVDTTSTYVVYRAPGACPAAGTTPLPASFVQVGTNSAPSSGTSLSFTDTSATLTAGAWCYDVEATLAGVSSKPSNFAPVTIAPGAVTITVTIAQ